MGLLDLLNRRSDEEITLMETLILDKNKEIAQINEEVALKNEELKLKDDEIKVLSQKIVNLEKNIEEFKIIGDKLNEFQNEISKLIQETEGLKIEAEIKEVEKAGIQEKYDLLLEECNKLREKAESSRETSECKSLDTNRIKSCSKKACIEIVKIDINNPLRCKNICKDRTECHSIGLLNIGHPNIKGTHITTIQLIFSNTSNESITISESSFKAIDSDGFSHIGKDLCEAYSEVDGFYSGYYDVPSKSKVKYEVLFIGIKKEINSIVYDNELTVNLKESENNIPDFGVKYDKILSDVIKYRSTNEELKSENAKLKKEVESKDSEIRKMKREESYNNYGENSNQYNNITHKIDDSLLIKYKIIEDDAYLRIVSQEKNDTVSFNREFNKSKDNYNWINEGDALISLKADNSYGYGLDGRTLIKSTVSGIFEFDNNKLIGYEQEICRIKKYASSEKETVILELEKQDIKDAIYKKERKKMIERETLDELLSEGKVFNVYTKKDGNRTTVPMDVANAVWNRDGGKCCICGKNQELEFDHIIPLSKGGATTFRNLQLLCKSCNAIKSDNI